MWGQRSRVVARACGERLARHKGLVVAVTALACFAGGVWASRTSQRLAAPTVRQLIGDLQKRDTLLHDTWEVIWMQTPRWLRDRCGMLEPQDPASVRARAPAQIAAFGPAAAPALPFLLRALHDPDASVQIAVLEALGELRDVARPTVAALLDFFSDPAQAVAGGYPLLRALTAESLVAIAPEDPQVLEALLASIEGHSNLDFRARIIEALGRMKASPRLLGALANWLQASEPVIRDAAVRAVGQAGPAAAELAPPLIRLFEALEQKRTLVAQADSSIAPNPSPSQPVPARRAWVAGSTNSPGAVLLMRPMPAMAAASSANVLARYGLASNPADSFGAQYQIVEALGKLGPGAQVALPLLTRAAAQRFAPYWNTAVFSKWQIDGDTAAACAALRPRLVETVPQADRLFVIELLGRIGPGAASEFFPCLHHRESSVRFGAVRALGECGPAATQALPELERLLRDDPKIAIRMAAEQALRRIAPDRPWHARVPSAVELLHLKAERPDR